MYQNKLKHKSLETTFEKRTGRFLGAILSKVTAACIYFVVFQRRINYHHLKKVLNKFTKSWLNYCNWFLKTKEHGLGNFDRCLKSGFTCNVFDT